MTPSSGILTITHVLIVLVAKTIEFFKFRFSLHLFSKKLLSDDLDLEVMRAYPDFGFFPKFAKRIASFLFL